MAGFLQTIEQRGRDKGRDQGRAEGVAEGQTSGKAQSLLKLMTKRFGPLPKRIERQIRSAREPDLDRWLDRVLDAATAEAVLEGA